MTTNNARDAFENVSQALDTAKDQNEQLTALEKLQTEVETDMRGMSAEESQQYIGQLTNALEASGQLPVLSLAYADQMGGNLDQDDLKSEMRTTNRFAAFGNNSARLDQVFLKYLTDNYDQGANLIETSNNNWVWKDSSISTDDISKKLTEFRETRDERKRVAGNQDSAAPFAEALLEGGDKSLFNFIDRYSKDNSLSKIDMMRYLFDAEASGSTDGVFSAENQNLVKDLVRNWDDENKGRWMRGGFRNEGYFSTGLSKHNLLKSTGYATLQGLVADSERRNAIARGENLPEVTDGGDAGDDAEQQAAESQDQTAPEETEDIAPTEPETVAVAKGDSYWRIAHRLLGESATNKEILAKMTELQELNNNAPLIWNPDNQQQIAISDVRVLPSRTTALPNVISI